MYFLRRKKRDAEVEDDEVDDEGEENVGEDVTVSIPVESHSIVVLCENSRRSSSTAYEKQTVR